MTKINCQCLEEVPPVTVVISGKLLRCGPLLLSVNNDRSSVSVRTAYEKRVLSKLFKTANVDVCWDIRPQVTDVTRAIRVRQSACDKKWLIRY